LTIQGKQVAIVGGGVAGLAAAEALASWGIAVTIIDKASAAGGHAARFSCKATDRCVACGACVAQDVLRRATARPGVAFLTDTRIAGIDRGDGFTIAHESQARSGTLRVDAVLLTSGFTLYDPSEKPYGYGKFPNVLTNLDAERILSEHDVLRRPSDGRVAEQIAFIQCVGSRDARIGHPWCSKICCGSALRMAGLIQHRQPRVSVTFFYIDVQTFGRNFDLYYDHTRTRVRMLRAIPGDIFKTHDDRLQVTWFDPLTHQSKESLFDTVILSTGLTPSPDNRQLSAMFGWPLTATGFFQQHDCGSEALPGGVFTAGAALGPMSIAETLDSAGKAVRDMVPYLKDDARELKR
jgi:heterodisulfide reductase subunit A2